MSIQCERALCIELVTDSGFLGREWRDNSYSKVSLIFTMSFLSIFALFSNHLVAMLVSITSLSSSNRDLFLCRHFI